MQIDQIRYNAQRNLSTTWIHSLFSIGLSQTMNLFFCSQQQYMYPLLTSAPSLISTALTQTLPLLNTVTYFLKIITFCLILSQLHSNLPVKIISCNVELHSVKFQSNKLLTSCHVFYLIALVVINFLE